MKNYKEVVDKMKLKFSSRNSTPVERTAITKDEWGVVEERIEQLESSLKQGLGITSDWYGGEDNIFESLSKMDRWADRSIKLFFTGETK